MLDTSTRYIVGFFIGGIVASTLLFTMQHLIATGENAYRATPVFRFLPYVHVEVAELVEMPSQKPVRPPVPDLAPPTDAPTDESTSRLELGLTLPPVTPTGPMTGAAKRSVFVDGDVQILTQPTPVYPERARRRGLEGYCTVEYGISAVGTVLNPTVVECSNSVFERASIQAAQRFKYRPRVVDGQAVIVPSHRNRFTFKLD